MGNSVNDNMLIKINISKEKHKNQMVSLTFDKGKKKKKEQKVSNENKQFIIEVIKLDGTTWVGIES